ncbi:MAG TPA: HlyD family secretion protein [Pirellulales bacterium]
MSRFAISARRSVVALVLLGALATVCLLFGLPWLAHRFTHSISRDAFVESHLVNLSPQVPGNVVEVYVQEQEQVKKGQLLALVDPSIYTREVELAAAKLDVMKAALAQAQADLVLLQQQVPQQVAAADAKLGAARDNETKSAAALAMVSQTVDDAVTAAQKSVDAAEAALTFASDDEHRFTALYTDGSGTQRRMQEATKSHDVAQAEQKRADALLGEAEANRKQIDIAQQELAAAKSAVAQAKADVELAKTGDAQIVVLERQVDQRTQDVAQGERALELAKTNLGYTRITAPFDCVIAKKWRHLGDYAHTGDPIFSIYNPDFMYVTVNLEETRLEGVSPGNWATLRTEAYSEPFRGRVVWIGSATGANFSLIPRDLSSGEFTYVIQRVPTRVAIERDDRWSLLKPGLSVTVDIEHGAGDKKWADEEWERERKEADVEAVSHGGPSNSGPSNSGTVPAASNSPSGVQP